MGCGSSAKGKYEEAGAPGSTPPAAAASKAEEPPAAAAAATPAATTAAPAAAAAAAPPAAPEKKAVTIKTEEKPTESDSVKPTPEELREAAKQSLKKFLVAPAEKAKKEEEEEEEEESDEDEIDMDEAAFEAQVTLSQSKGGAARKSRMAVSAEASMPLGEFQAPVYEKTDDQEARLTKAISASFMFAALSGDALPIVIKAFKEEKIAAGTTVISQGDEVVSEKPALFVLESGKLSVFKTGHESAVFQYDTPGQYFGELALLYNAPRAATVVADEECIAWSIDRDTFNALVKNAARIAAKNRLGFLEQVPILKGLTAEEKAKVCDVMNVQIVPKDTHIIKQGEVGTCFYILESGKLEARKDGQKVMEYKEKDYFGELALLRDAPRACDVVTTETSKVLSLDAASFKRIIGSLEDVMRERAALYAEVAIPK